jgi:hypothetical protein
VSRADLVPKRGYWKALGIVQAPSGLWFKIAPCPTPDEIDRIIGEVKPGSTPVAPGHGSGPGL